jgi:hypothetical protein
VNDELFIISEERAHALKISSAAWATAATAPGVLQSLHTRWKTLP